MLYAAIATVIVAFISLIVAICAHIVARKALLVTEKQFAPCIVLENQIKLNSYTKNNSRNFSFRETLYLKIKNAGQSLACGIMIITRESTRENAWNIYRLSSLAANTEGEAATAGTIEYWTATLTEPYAHPDTQAVIFFHDDNHVGFVTEYRQTAFALLPYFYKGNKAKKLIAKSIAATGNGPVHPIMRVCRFMDRIRAKMVGNTSF